MNQKTAKLLNNIAVVFNKKPKSLRKLWNTLDPKQKEITRRDFEEILRKGELEMKQLEAQKKKEANEHAQKLEDKMKKDK